MTGESSTSPPLDATVLIATYNRASILGEAITAVLAQQTPPDFRWELLIVDNNSRDETRTVVERYARESDVPVRYLFEGRQGKSHALNTGLEQARGAIVAFTDDDVLVPPDWIATAQRVLGRWNADAAGGRILPRWELPPPSWLLRNAQLHGSLALMEVERPQVLHLPLKGPASIWGANMAFRRSVFEKVGLFDVQLGPSGTRPVNFEDVDLVERTLRSGGRAVYDPELVVNHRIPAERMRMAYFRRWALVSGRAARLRSTPATGRFPVLGRPAWLYLRAGATLVKWLIAMSLRRPIALDLELDFFKLAGLFWWYREGERRSAKG
jgi:glycosyltransferase involved in cell wall biosynthesis